MLTVIKLRLLGLRDEYLVFIVLTLMAFGLTAIFGTTMSQYKPTISIVNLDKTFYSQEIIDELKGSHPNFIFNTTSYESAVKDVDEGNVLTSIIIEDDFGEQIAKGDRAVIKLLKVRDDRDIFLVESILTDISNKLMINIKISELTASYISSSKNIDYNKVKNIAYTKAIDNWRFNRPVEIEGEIIDANEGINYDSMKHTLIGFSLFFSMYTMVFGIGTILNDRQYNTWQRMIISPLSKASILGGSMIVAFIMGATQLGILILAGKYAFNIDWGTSIGGILMVAAAFVFAVTSLGLFLSGLVKTHSQLAAITPVILTSTAMIGGCMWPLEIVNSKILLFLANFTPQKWAVQGMERIAAYGQGFEAAIMPSLILVLMGLIFFGAGVKLVKFDI